MVSVSSKKPKPRPALLERLGSTELQFLAGAMVSPIVKSMTCVRAAIPVRAAPLRYRIEHPRRNAMRASAEAPGSAVAVLRTISGAVGGS